MTVSDRARIVFLGTGGVNSIERSSAGIAVELPSGEALLLDTCGGNEILRQMHAARVSTNRVRAIVVTHQHYDHAAGLPLMILQASRHTEALDVHCPAVSVEPLKTVVEVMCPAASGRMGARLRWHGVSGSEGDTVQVGDAALTFFAVDHAVDGIGVVLERGGRRLVYSGDTGPSDALVRAARDAEILIHEATGLAADTAAAERTHAAGHSTASDAGQVAARAAVKELVLTHVGDASPERCARLVEEARAAYGGPVRVAADLEELCL